MKSSKIYTAATLLILAVSNFPFRWLDHPASAKISNELISITITQVGRQNDFDHRLDPVFPDRPTCFLALTTTCWITLAVR